MGALDEAIRQHLELKRKLGASEEELKAKENEAFGRGKPLPPAADEAVGIEDAAPPPEPQSEQEPESKVFMDDLATETAEHDVDSQPPAREDVIEAEAEAELIEAEAEAVGAPAPPLDFERDEVLPEESLEREPEGNAPASPDDVLEETPEFFEQPADQDRLWFEQKPPKDFDFDD
jgi:hypothetical protein